MSTEFEYWNSYIRFANHVRKNYRYILDQESIAFLDAVKSTMSKRIIKATKGTKLVRAQFGVETSEDYENATVHFYGHNKNRMKPLKHVATEGRVNPKGIPVLYLASSIQTAISEIRPWINSQVSVASFELSRDLKIIDVSKKSEFPSILMLPADPAKPVDAVTKEKCVWTDINAAFSTPQSNTDNGAEYIPTQILAEVFKSEGLDGIIYKSQFGEESGYNIGLFSLEDAEAISCAPFSIKSIKIEYDQMDSGQKYTENS